MWTGKSFALKGFEQETKLWPQVIHDGNGLPGNLRPEPAGSRQSIRTSVTTRKGQQWLQLLLTLFINIKNTSLYFHIDGIEDTAIAGEKLSLPIYY